MNVSACEDYSKGDTVIIYHYRIYYRIDTATPNSNGITIDVTFPDLKRLHTGADSPAESAAPNSEV